MPSHFASPILVIEDHKAHFAPYIPSKASSVEVMKHHPFLAALNLFVSSTSSSRAVQGVSFAGIRRQSQRMIMSHISNSNNKDNTMTAQAVGPSFYKRALPETCVAFASRKGKEIFASAMTNNGLKSFFALIQQFTTQTEPAYCGLSTLVLVLNALSVDPQQNWKGPWRWYEEKMLNCCIDLEEVKSTGITLRDFQCLAHCQGLTVDLTYCDEQSTLDDFRNAVQRACLSNDHEDNEHDDESSSSSSDGPLDILVVSYSRKVLSQTGSGHFSPIAAYDATSDSVLILDTARFKYGAHWVKLPLIYEAMKTIDPDTGKSRGFAVLSFAPHPPAGPQPTSSSLSLQGDDESSVVQPGVSILFRSKMSQNPARRKYKEYLESRKGGASGVTTFTWEEARGYWQNEDTKVDSVWNILEPLRLSPPNQREDDNVSNLRSLMNDLLQTLDPSPEEARQCCNRVAQEKTRRCISEKEALLVVYLGSISNDCRTDLVMNLHSDASHLTREQLLNEAELVATAIKCSEESSF